MARTILGLVKWSDGKVYFGDPPCDTRIACITEDVEGCVEWTGGHAGQVKVTITQADSAACNDTYYGCVNWATGKFQITIPSDCCSYGGSCPGDPVYMNISGITECSGLTCGWPASLPSKIDVPVTFEDGSVCIYENLGGSFRYSLRWEKDTETFSVITITYLDGGCLPIGHGVFFQPNGVEYQLNDTVPNRYLIADCETVDVVRVAGYGGTVIPTLS